ncbi:putative multidrug resistance protein MdtD [Candidatus Methanobinarius endosymbioticus]|uniref:Putative multidrug resistance protein MdtD n=1 Tax=Candidatus Methanobinarius endosymbioticus TaxID=2006182 RepID=A0A366MCW6_9EURY|nr:putative multidrug resistance protein MdtD [Candidatus Methanobinarius endosymbioticus]
MDTNNINNADNNILKKTSSKNLIIFLASFTSFITAFSTSAIAVALPAIATEFAIDAILQNWLATSFLLAVATFSVPFGKLSEKYGLKKFFIMGMIIFILGSIGVSLSFSAYSVIFFRVIQGIAGALLNVAGFAMITEALSPNERGKGIGINVSCVYIGLTLAPVLGGILTQNFGWPSIFYIIIPLLFIPLIITILKVKEEWITGHKDPFDFIGTIIYFIGILLFMYGFTILNELNGIILTVLGLILLIGFAIWELRQKFPVFEVKLFKNSKFSSSSLAALISYLATFIVTYILNYHLQYIEGMDPQVTGIILIVTPALMAIIAPFSGKLSDKIDPQILSAIGMGFVAVAIFILTFLEKGTPLYVIVIAMILQGIGYGIFSSSNTNSIMGSVPRKFASLASATVSTVRVIGQTMSLGMLTVIFAVVMGSVPIIPKYFPLLTQSSQIACIISVVLCVIAVIASLVGLKSNVKVNI